MNEDLYQIAEDSGITVDNVNLQKNKALSVRLQDRDYIAIGNMENSAEERTCLAHELGHCETGSFYEVGSPLSVRGKAEHRANKWAMLKCVPKDELKSLLQQGYQFYEIAEHFNVTEMFILKAIEYYFIQGVII